MHKRKSSLCPLWIMLGKEYSKLLFLLGKSCPDSLCWFVSDHDSIEHLWNSHLGITSKHKLQLGFPGAIGEAFSDMLSVHALGTVLTTKSSRVACPTVWVGAAHLSWTRGSGKVLRGNQWAVSLSLNGRGESLYCWKILEGPPRLASHSRKQAFVCHKRELLI